MIARFFAGLNEDEQNQPTVLLGVLKLSTPIEDVLAK